MDASLIITPPLPDGLDTPTLVIDLDVVERNAARLAGAMAARGIAARPHAKTHIERVSDYHGVVRIPPGTPCPALGEVLAIVPNHICPVVDLRDTFLLTRNGATVGIWPVSARGRSG